MHKILGLFLVFVALVSCKNENSDIKMNAVNSSWKKDTVQNFDFEIADAQGRKNIIFVVRNNNDYPYSNLRLFVDLLDHSTKKTTTDTVNLVIAKPNGEWIGKGFGNTKEILLPYKANYQFPKNGKYSFRVKHAMRNDILPGIEDVGIKIENIKP